MRKLAAFAAVLHLALIAEIPARAQFVGIPTTVAQLPDCTPGRHGRIWIVRDAVGNGDCSVGGGTDASMCLCSAEGFVPIIASSTPAANSLTESMLKAVDAASDEECLTYETTTGDFEWQSCGTGIGGSTGATDDAILRADGVGGATLQASAVTIADTTGDITTPGFIQVKGGATSASVRLGGSTASQPALGTHASTNTTNLHALLADASIWTGINAAGFYLDQSGMSVGNDGGKLSLNSDAGVYVLREDHATINYILSSVLVEANTAGSGSPNVLAASESGTCETNEGATEKNYQTLPSAAAGYRLCFYIQDADGMRVTAATGDSIRIIDKVTAAAGYIESTTIGSMVVLVSLNATEWFGGPVHGTWTDGTFTYDDTSLTTP